MGAQGAVFLSELCAITLFGLRFRLCSTCGESVQMFTLHKRAEGQQTGSQWSDRWRCREQNARFIRSPRLET